MDTLGEIASVVAALAAIITLWVTIRNSKGNILKRIDKKEKQLKIIEQEQYLKYGVHRPIGGPVTPLEMKMARLKREIAELRRKL